MRGVGHHVYWLSRAPVCKFSRVSLPLTEVRGKERRRVGKKGTKNGGGGGEKALSSPTGKEPRGNGMEKEKVKGRFSFSFNKTELCGEKGKGREEES